MDSKEENSFSMTETVFVTGSFNRKATRIGGSKIPFAGIALGISVYSPSQSAGIWPWRCPRRILHQGLMFKIKIIMGKGGEDIQISFGINGTLQKIIDKDKSSFLFVKGHETTRDSPVEALFLAKSQGGLKVHGYWGFGQFP